MKNKELIRIAATADIHYTENSQGIFREVFEEISSAADILLICGDFTNTGDPKELILLLNDIALYLTIPVLAVMGNHDHESARESDIEQLCRGSVLTLLKGNSKEFDGIGFAGTKGFAGGFGKQALQPWGEPAIKQFVREAEMESLKLDEALRSLNTKTKIVLMHYAPIEETIVGEPPQIYPFLGSDKFEEVVETHGVNAIFHGHAHRGKLQGRTKSGIPVYNVSEPLLKKELNQPYIVVELPVSG